MSCPFLSRGNSDFQIHKSYYKQLMQGELF